MSVKVPVFRDPAVTDFLTRYIESKDREYKMVMSRVSANDSLLLFSPSRKVYEVRVDDAGVISATLVADVAP